MTTVSLDTSTMHALETMLDAVADRAVARFVAAMPGPAPRRPLVDTTGLAEYLHCSKRTIYTMRQDGLPCLYLADSPRFDLDEVLAWLREQKQ